MKKIISIAVTLSVLVSCFAWTTAYADDNIKVIIDGINLTMDQPPILKEDRTLVPFRAIFEALGANVNWDEATKTASGTKDSIEIKLKIGDKTAYVAGKAVTLDVPAQIINARTLVPVRFISESLGASVSWNGKTKTVTIKTTSDAPVGSLDDNTPGIDGDVICLDSSDDIYALNRLLAQSYQQSGLIYLDNTLTMSDDLAKFDFPAGLTSKKEKIAYLQSASYKLMSDITLSIQQAPGADFYLGIGSEHYPFMGTFDGNGKVITLSSNSKSISLTTKNSPGIGFFGKTKGAKIVNAHVKLTDDLVVIGTNRNYLLLGVLAGEATTTEFKNCSVTMLNANCGADYSAAEMADINEPYVGGLVGQAKRCVLTDCTVNMKNASLYAKAQHHDSDSIYAMHAVGGLIGCSYSGSNNIDNIGRLGNQIYNCKVISNNDTQKNVIIASVVTGDEIAAGGLIGISYNNLLAKNCTVNITKGNIVAEKTGSSDTSSLFGTQAGGIIGRMEHTGVLCNCDVTGDYLNIVSTSPDNQSSVGGIVGVDVGPWHRDVVSILDCDFNGSKTSNIKLTITSNSGSAKYKTAGGIVGDGTYKIQNCSVKNTMITNSSKAGVANSYIGTTAGFWDDGSKRYNEWESGDYFTPGTPGITGCTSSGVTFDLSNNTIKTNP